MRIDLHCHTRNVKKGDGDGREIDSEAFVEKMRFAEVGIAGIANHNVFDYEQYVEFRNAAEEVCQVWPGIELDMEGENQWHLIVSCNPRNAMGLRSAVDSLIGKRRPEDVLLSIKDVVSALDSLDVLYIPHGHGKRSGKKPRSIPDDARAELESAVGNPSRIIHEPTHHSLGVLSRNGYRVILGSDVKDWRSYDGSNLLDLRFPIVSFEAFARLVEGNVDEYNSCILNEGAPVSVKVVPFSGAKERTVELFRGVNIIFGQKGTGKTKLIESVEQGLREQGQNAALYRSSNFREAYNAELSPEWETCRASAVGASNCEEEFKAIAKWSENAIISLQSTYIHYHRSQITNKNRRRLKVADITTLPYFTRDADLKKVKEDWRHVKLAIAELEQVDPGHYLEAEKANLLMTMLGELSRKVSESLETLIVEKYSTRLCGFSIANIKNHAARLCDAPSAPSSAGFLSFASNRIRLHRSCSEILANINGQSREASTVFGVLKDKGTILTVTRHLMIGEGANPAEYFNRKMTSLTSIRRQLKRLQEEAFGNDAVSVCEALVEDMRDKNVSSTDNFVGTRKYTILRGSDAPYVPSDGELSIVMLSRFLEEDRDYYLLDEPERGMGNSFVDEEIRPLLLGLAARGKTVVAATHNANIAVRTAPVQAILAEYHGAGGFAIYSGSPFSNALVSHDDSSDTRTWSKASMTILEGGEEAFYDRKDMYELS